MPEVSALAVGAPDGGRQQLTEIFDQHGWRILWARTRAEAEAVIDSTPVEVVIAERDLPEGGWRELLLDLLARTEPPALVVTSRLADESLWAEVLNMGGYDVLAQPLDTEEVERVVSAARRHVTNERLRSKAHSVRRSYLRAAG